MSAQPFNKNIHTLSVVYSELLETADLAEQQHDSTLKRLCHDYAAQIRDQIDFFKRLNSLQHY